MVPSSIGKLPVHAKYQLMVELGPKRSNRPLGLKPTGAYLLAGTAEVLMP